MLKFIMNNIFRNMEIYDIGMTELVEKQEHGAIVVDVRSTQEYNENHIYGSINIPYYLINKNVYNILPNREKEIIVYCGVGSRSKMAYKKLLKLGYKNIYNLYGGIENWQ